MVADKSYTTEKPVTNEAKLNIYSLYKQATKGDVEGSQPWSVQFEARAKWDAWAKHKGMSKVKTHEFIGLVFDFQIN